MPFAALEYLPGISIEDGRRLRSRGINSTNLLMHAAMLDIDRRRLSRRTGISAERILELANQAALMEVSGITRHLPVVRRLGINRLGELKVRDAETLHGDLVEAIGYAGAPTLGEVQYWVSQARMIDIVEQELNPEATPGLH